MSAREARLRAAGLTLPDAPRPLGAYVPAVRAGDLLFLSGMLPLAGGAPAVRGRLGADVSLEDGRRAARLAALNALAVAREALDDLDDVARVVRLAVHVACVSSFDQHAAVADGASAVLDAAFPEAGHARLALGASSLPAGVPVELDVILQLR